MYIINDEDKEIEIDIDLSELEAIKEKPASQSLKTHFKAEDRSRDTRMDFDSIEEWEASIEKSLLQDIMSFNESLTDEQSKELTQFLKIEALIEKVSSNTTDTKIELNPLDFVGFEREYENLVNQLTQRKQEVKVSKKPEPAQIDERPRSFTKNELDDIELSYEEMLNDFSTSKPRVTKKFDKPKPKYEAPKPVEVVKPKIEPNVEPVQFIPENIPTDIPDTIIDRAVVFLDHAEIRWEQRFDSVFDKEQVTKELISFVKNDAVNKMIGVWQESFFKTRDMHNFKVVYKPLNQIIVVKTMYRRDKASKEAYASSKR